jgi:hypothetical protein
MLRVYGAIGFWWKRGLGTGRNAMVTCGRGCAGSETRAQQVGSGEMLAGVELILRRGG